MSSKKMEAGVVARTNGMAGLKTMLTAMQLKAKENHEKLMKMLSK